MLADLLEAMTIPLLLTPSSIAPGTLFGPGTPFPTREAFEKSVSASGSASVVGNPSDSGSGDKGFQGVFHVNGRIDSMKLDKELAK